MMIQVAVEFAIGDVVQFKVPDADGDRMQGMVIGYYIRLGEMVTYKTQHCNGEVGDYYSITLEKVETE